VIHSLIGKKYKLGADGSNNEIDCIHLVYAVLKELNIPAPKFKQEWYKASTKEIMRDLKKWGHPVKIPLYDGDVVLQKQEHWSFGVVWQKGVLYINRLSEQVAWMPLANITAPHCYRMKNSLLQ
jgi:hypothetical protein